MTCSPPTPPVGAVLLETEDAVARIVAGDHADGATNPADLDLAVIDAIRDGDLYAALRSDGALLFLRGACTCDADGPPPGLLARARAYLCGVREFRSDLTTHFDGDLAETYDAGRDRAHALTLRRFDS